VIVMIEKKTCFVTRAAAYEDSNTGVA
jgi:hypothetical protein